MYHCQSEASLVIFDEKENERLGITPLMQRYIFNPRKNN